MYIKLFILCFSFSLLFNALAQNVGIGISNPQEKLHIAGTTRINALTSSTSPTSISDKMIWTDNNGTVYAFPTATPGKVLGINPSGILAWLSPTAVVDADNGLYYNSSSGKLRQGGSLVENTTISQSNFNYLYHLTGTGIWEVRNSASSGNGLFVNINDMVGIGTNAPQNKLHLGGLTNTLRVDGIATGGTFMKNAVASTDRLVYTDENGQIQALPTGATGNVLQVNSSGVVSWGNPLYWKITGNDGISQPAVPATYGTTLIGSNENWIGTTDANAFVLGTANKERMRINADGSIGIGLSATANVTELLTINSVGAKVYPFNAYTNTASAVAIWGENLASTGTNNGSGVYGGTTQSNGAGVWGTNSHQNGMGILGQNTAAAGTSTGIGVFGSTLQASGAGLKGQNSHIDGDGVVGINTANSNTGNGNGVLGQASQALGAGVWGQNLNNAGYGVYGVNLAASNTNIGVGVFGGTAQAGGAGLWGQNANANGDAVVGINTALAGTSLGSGVYGQTSQKSTASGIVAGIYGWCNAAGATDFGFPRASVYGDGSATGSYACGVFGDGGTSIRSGGVIGDNYALGRGALGYISAANLSYAVYGFSSAYELGVFTGKMANPNETENQMNNQIGLGIYGGVMGGWVRGIHYGLHTKGGEYSLYVDGQSVTNRPAIQLIQNEESEKRTVAYMTTSMSADVYARGSAKLENGTIYIAFHEDFKAGISAQIPLNITVTPMGESEGVYVTDITTEGFRVVENRQGHANVAFNWLAVGTQKGYEKAQPLSATILSQNFDKQMNGVMFNDNNTNDAEVVGIYYDGQNVQLGKTPATFEQTRLVNPRLLKHKENHINRNQAIAIQENKVETTLLPEIDRKKSSKAVKAGK